MDSKAARRCLVFQRVDLQQLRRRIAKPTEVHPSATEFQRLVETCKNQHRGQHTHKIPDQATPLGGGAIRDHELGSWERLRGCGLTESACDLLLYQPPSA